MRFRGNWRGLSPPHAEDPGQVTGPPLPDNCVEHPNKGKLSSQHAENPRCQAQLRLNPRHSTGQVRGAARDPPFSERPPPPRPAPGTDAVQADHELRHLSATSAEGVLSLQTHFHPSHSLRYTGLAVSPLAGMAEAAQARRAQRLR